MTPPDRHRNESCDVPAEHAPGPARPYPCGWRCDRHAPWAAAGQPEPQPGPGIPAGAWTTPSPINDSRVHDARAVASGKRRANPQAYRAAQAATGKP
ncbi:hypothetical protein [Streptomyces sp. NPDC006193]|uniref:hypothetical protein n=1 Tax=Streptomyces sp. NPDC006193 TaxID=3155717 RepID=UPI0033BBFC87